MTIVPTGRMTGGSNRDVYPGRLARTAPSGPPRMVRQADGSYMTDSSGGGISTGRSPRIDLRSGLYQGYQGGLYPGGVNMRPAAHDNDADRAARLMLLDASGEADAAGGRIVLLTIGMSNTTQETQAFIPLATADPQFNRSVVVVDGAQGGWSADRLVDPINNGDYCSAVETRLAVDGVTDA